MQLRDRTPDGPPAPPPFVLYPAVAFRDAGLMLGAGSHLARMRRETGGLALEEDGKRVLTLLSVAKGAAVSADVLRHIAAANKHWRNGDKALANIRLIFGDLPRVPDRETAHRLQLATYLLDRGLAPDVLMKELGYRPLPAAPPCIDVTKYNRDEPRVPAGNGDESGRWTRGDGRIVVATEDEFNDPSERLGHPRVKTELDNLHPDRVPIPISPSGNLPTGIGAGPYARFGVPAGPSLRPSTQQQKDINTLGRAFGCHTCGTKDPGLKSGNFVGDHQPPSALAPPETPQFYLPHCKKCSLGQGGRVTAFKRRP